MLLIPPLQSPPNPSNNPLRNLTPPSNATAARIRHPHLQSPHRARPHLARDAGKDQGLEEKKNTTQYDGAGAFARGLEVTANRGERACAIWFLEVEL